MEYLGGRFAGTLLVNALLLAIRRNDHTDAACSQAAACGEVDVAPFQRRIFPLPRAEGT